MNVEQKVQALKAKRANILGRAKRETAKLEREFRTQQNGKKPLMEQIKSFSGRFYAKVGPMLKEAKSIQNAIELLRS